jgi:hypothetical protein
MFRFPVIKRQQTAVIILGMHRSGTSSLVGSLQQKGLYLGKVYEKSDHNLKGNRENQEIMDLNDAVLAYNHGSWDHPPDSLNWDDNLLRERDRIIRHFVESRQKFFGFKDPRTVFTLPFWEEGLKRIRLVGTFRHPLKVARSLYARNKIPLEDSLRMWDSYNTRLLKYYEKHNFPMTHFDVPPEEYYSRIDQVAEMMGMKASGKTNEEPFFDQELVRNKEVEEDTPLRPTTLSIYETLRSIYESQMR